MDGINKRFVTGCMILLCISFLVSCSANRIGSPGEAKHAISVAASTHNNTITDFSSRGPSRFGYMKPDITAPGRDSIAARAKGTHLGRSVSGDDEELYTKLSGTSMATPQVAGASALLYQAYKEKYGTSPEPAVIKAALMKSATQLEVKGLLYDEIHQGAGILSLDKAISYILSDSPIIAASPGVWNVRKVSSVADRASHIGEPMFTRALLPGDLLFQKFVIIIGSSLPNVVVRTSDPVISVNQMQELRLGDVRVNQDVEFTGFLQLASDAASGTYQEYINVYSQGNLVLSIPIRFEVAEPMGTITGETERMLTSGFETKHYYFDIEPNTYGVEINITSTDPCVNAYMYDPYYSLVDYEYRVDSYYIDSTKEEKGDSIIDMINILNPSSGRYTLELSNIMWGTDGIGSLSPDIYCEDDQQVTFHVKAFNTEVSPTHFEEKLRKEETVRETLSIENKGGKLENVTVSSYCGNKDTYAEEYTLHLTFGDLYDLPFNDFEDTGYIAEKLINVVPGSMSLKIDVTDTGYHPTVVNVYDPYDNLVATSANTPLEPPETTTEVEIVPIQNPTIGQWKIVVYNSDVANDYVAGEEHVGLSVTTEIGYPCDYLTVEPYNIESLDEGAIVTLNVTFFSPDKKRDGSIFINTPVKRFTVPFTLVLEEQVKDGNISMKISQNEWNYLWLDIPPNSLKTRIKMEKECGSNVVSGFLSAELTPEIGQIQSYIFRESHEAYKQNYEWGATDGIVFNDSISEESGHIQFQTDSDLDGYIDVIKGNYHIYLDRVYANNGTLEMPTYNIGMSSEQNVTKQADGNIYVRHAYDVNDLSYDEFFYGEIYLYDEFFTYLVPVSSDYVMYLDIDHDKNFSDEVPYEEDDILILNDSKYEISDIYVSVVKDEPEEEEIIQEMYSYIRLTYLEESHVGTLSPHDTYLIGSLYSKLGKKMFIIPLKESYEEEIIFDLDQDSDFVDEQHFLYGIPYVFDNETYIFDTIDVEEGTDYFYASLYVLETYQAHVGTLSEHGKYLTTQLEMQPIDSSYGSYPVLIPINGDDETYDDIVVDMNKNDDFTDDTVISKGDFVYTSDIFGLQLIYYDIDGENLQEYLDVCDERYCDFRVSLAIKGLLRNEYEWGHAFSTLYSASGEFYSIIYGDDQEYLYIDLNHDDDLDDPNEGPYYLGDVIDINGEKVRFSDRYPLTLDILKHEFMIEKELVPVSWKLAMEGIDMSCDTGYILGSTGESFTLDVMKGAHVTLKVHNMENEMPIPGPKYYYEITLTDNTGNEKLVPMRSISVYDEVDISQYVTEGEYTVDVSFYDTDMDPVDTIYRVYYKNLKTAEDLNLEISHELYPVNAYITNDDLYQLVFENTEVSEETVECDVTVLNEVGNAINTKKISVTVPALDSVTEDINYVRGYMTGRTTYYVTTSCLHQSQVIRDIKKIDGSEKEMHTFLNKQFYTENESILYNIDIDSDLTFTSASLRLLVKKNKNVLHSETIEPISVPFSTVGTFELDLKLGNYVFSAVFLYTADNDSGVQAEPVTYSEIVDIPFSVLKRKDTLDTDNDGIIDYLDDDKDGDGILDTVDTMIGKKGNLNTNLKWFTIKIDNDENTDKMFSSVSDVAFIEEDSPKVMFKHDFSKHVLDVRGVEIRKQDDGENKGWMLVKGLNTTQKTVYVDKKSDSSQAVCIKDSEIEDINEVSLYCTGIDEVLITCDNETHGRYLCSDDGSYLAVSGLMHSGVVEHTGAPPLSGQSEGDDTHLDTGSGTGGGSGGGGSSGGSYAARTITINLDEKNDKSILLTIGDTIKLQADGAVYLFNLRKVFIKEAVFVHSNREFKISKGSSKEIVTGRSKVLLYYDAYTWGQGRFMFKKEDVQTIEMSEVQRETIEDNLDEIPEQQENQAPLLKGEISDITIVDEKDNSYMLLIGILVMTVIALSLGTYVVLQKMKPEDDALTKYIRQSLQQGFTIQQIEQKLLSIGWKREQIDEAKRKIKQIQ